MAVDVVMPQMGESIFEGTITKWLKKPGERVERDEPLFEISTDKVDAEIPAPSAGVLKEIKVNEGQTVPVQTVVGVIDAAGAAAGAPAGAKAEAQTPAKAAPAKSGKEPGPAQAKLEAAAQQPKPTPAAPQADGSGERTKPGAPATAQTKQAAGKDVEAREGDSADKRRTKRTKPNRERNRRKRPPAAMATTCAAHRSSAVSPARIISISRR